ncbi:MAG: amino acid permease-associated region [Geminicoccaceae bacterium]|nr:amino acid permease-associated region [Geminicoccaceae bacterium]
MVVGTIIGASIFVQPSLVSGAVPSPAGMLLVWGAAGILTLIGVLVTAELASAFPSTGGVYVFLRESYSPALGFLWCWAMFWSMHTGIIAAIATVCARYIGFFVPLDDTGTRLVAIAVILALSAINYVGVRHGTTLQTAFTVGKVAAVAAIVIAGIGAPERASPADATAAVVPSASAFITATVAGLFAFGGWHMVTYTGDETVDARRTIPRALMIGTLVVTASYIAVNAAYLAVLTPAAVAASNRVAADFADAVLGSGGAASMAALVVFSTVGALIGIILTGPRVYLAAAEDGLLPRAMAAVHPRFATPHHAIALQAVWASVLVATGTYRALFTRVVYTEWIFFGLMAGGIFLLRRRPGYAPMYRAWGYPVLPVVFIVSTAVIVANQLVADPWESITGLAIVLAGLPFYYFRIRRIHGRTTTGELNADH